MKRIWIDAIIILILCGAFVGAWFLLGWGRVEVEKIVIKRETPTKYENTKTPENNDEYVKAFYDPWLISGVARGMWFDVEVHNNYQRATKSFEIECKIKPMHHELMPLLIGAIAYDSALNKFEVGYGAALIYSYNFNRAGLGLGAGVIKYPSRFEVIAMAGGFLRF